MRKVLFVLLLPALFTSQVVISTEKDVIISPEQQYNLRATNYGTYYTDIPSNPNVYEITPVYDDANLQIVSEQLKPDTSFSIQELHVNENGTPVFKLSTGKFIIADKRVVYDDLILSEENTTKEMWVKKDATFYSEIPLNNTKTNKSIGSPYTKVTLETVAKTYKGEFAKITDKGWVLLSDLDETDNRMEAVQELLASKYNKDEYAIYVKQLTTNKTAGIHQDKLMYSASIAKLPVLYYTQKKINENQYSLSQGLKYIAEVNTYLGAYNPSGSGSIPKTADNKDYSIQDLINRDAKESDNVANNILGYYLTDQASENYQEYIKKIVGQEWNPKDRNASAEMAGRMMEAIYYQNGEVLEALSQTNFDDQRISKDISVKVAHKIGDAYDYKHDVAVVYTDFPFILSIFTDRSNYDTISQIANDVYGVLK